MLKFSNDPLRLSHSSVLVLVRVLQRRPWGDDPRTICGGGGGGAPHGGKASDLSRRQRIFVNMGDIETFFYEIKSLTFCDSRR